MIPPDTTTENAIRPILNTNQDTIEDLVTETELTGSNNTTTTPEETAILNDSAKHQIPQTTSDHQNLSKHHQQEQNNAKNTSYDQENYS